MWFIHIVICNKEPALIFHYSCDHWTRTLKLSGNNWQNMSGKAWGVQLPESSVGGGAVMWPHLLWGRSKATGSTLGQLGQWNSGGWWARRWGKGLVRETAKGFEYKIWSPVLSGIKMTKARWTHHCRGRNFLLYFRFLVIPEQVCSAATEHPLSTNRRKLKV